MRVRNTILAFSALICAQTAVSMESFPAYEQKKRKQLLVSLRKESAATLEGLPAELQSEIIFSLSKSFLHTSLHAILALAATNKALHAAMNNPIAMITFLKSLKYRANIVDVLQKFGSKSKTLPVMQDSSVIAWLIAAKASAPLQWGREFCDVVKSKDVAEVQKALLNGGIDLNWQDRNGISALSFVTFNDLNEIGRFLLMAGANPDNRKYDFHMSELMIAANAANLELVKLFINAGARLNIKDTNEQNALILTIKSARAMKKGPENEFAIIKALLDAGENPESKDIWGKSVRDYAVEKGRRDIAQIIDAQLAKKKQKLALKQSVKQ